MGTTATATNSTSERRGGKAADSHRPDPSSARTEAVRRRTTPPATHNSPPAGPRGTGHPNDDRYTSSSGGPKPTPRASPSSTAPAAPGSTSDAARKTTDRNPVSNETKETWKNEFKSPEDIQKWIDGKFQYDGDRYKEQIGNHKTPPMNSQDFYNYGDKYGTVKGACMDLAQFGVTVANETFGPGTASLMEIPNTWTKNVPGHDKGETFRHWIGVYQDPTTHQFFGFADSRMFSMGDKPYNPPKGLDTNNGQGYGSAKELFEAYANYFNNSGAPFAMGAWNESYYPGHFNGPKPG